MLDIFNCDFTTGDIRKKFFAQTLTLADLRKVCATICASSVEIGGKTIRSRCNRQETACAASPSIFWSSAENGVPPTLYEQSARNCAIGHDGLSLARTNSLSVSMLDCVISAALERDIEVASRSNRQLSACVAARRCIVIVPRQDMGLFKSRLLPDTKIMDEEEFLGG